MNNKNIDLNKLSELTNFQDKENFNLIPTLNILFNNKYSLFKKGGRIKIKEKNKGKFTDYCNGKVTLKCIEKGKNSPSPTIRKRATFADNSRKWKHKDGGMINNYNIDKLNNLINNLK